MKYMMYKINNDIFALLYVMFSCVFVFSPYGVLCQVWLLTLTIPDLFLRFHFSKKVRYPYCHDKELDFHFVRACIPFVLYM